MTIATLALFKFLAIGSSAACGIVAALTDTRDKATGKVTRAGWILVSFLVISGSVAAVTQTMEASEDRKYRLREYKALYDLVHPLGELNVQFNVSFPMSSLPDGIGGNWLKRVRDTLPHSKDYIVIRNPDHELRPREDEGNAFTMLAEPEFDIGINRQPAKAFNDELLFQTVKPTVSVIIVNFKHGIVESQIEAKAIRLIDKRKILSWLDLYDSEVTAYLPRAAPSGIKFTRFAMTFMTGAQFGQLIEVPLSMPRKRAGDYKMGYVSLLTESEIGPKPVLVP